MSNGDKSLFIPLRAEWYNKFQDGSKNVEYRAYGPRWNEKTCVVGRNAVIAYGYGWPRMMRRVTKFRIIPFAKAPKAARDIFPNAEFIAAIHLGK